MTQPHRPRELPPSSLRDYGGAVFDLTGIAYLIAHPKRGLIADFAEKSYYELNCYRFLLHWPDPLKLYHCELESIR